MEGLAVAIENTRAFLNNLPALDANAIRYIHFYCDNMGAIHRIFSSTPGKAEACSLRFRTAALELLDNNPDLHIGLEWVPGHFEIRGNERADQLAKDGGPKQPVRPGYLSLSYAGSIRRKELALRWKAKWIRENKPNRPYSIANTNPPSFQPLERYTMYNREIASRIFQVRVGHAHIGEYYHRMNLDADPACPCGDIAIQTREHILQECALYEQHRHLLGDDHNERSLSNILGTDAGIERLAKFIDASGAFSKAPDPG